MFDITEYEHDDPDIVSINADDKAVEYNIKFGIIEGCVIFNKNDAIALAKHFELIK